MAGTPASSIFQMVIRFGIGFALTASALRGRNQRFPSIFLRNCPVYDFSHAATSSGVPSQTIFAAFVAAFRTEVDQVVRHLDDIQIVLDNQRRCCPFRSGCCRTLDELVHVCHVQPGRRLVQNVDRTCPSRVRLSSVASLTRCASPPESVVDGWPELDIAQARRRSSVSQLACGCSVGSRRTSMRFLDGHVQHVGNILALVASLPASRGCSACPLHTSHGTINIRQEVHLDFHDAVARSRLRTARP